MYQLYNCFDGSYHSLFAVTFEQAIDEAFRTARKLSGCQFIIYDEYRNPAYHFYT